MLQFSFFPHCSLGQFCFTALNFLLHVQLHIYHQLLIFLIFLIFPSFLQPPRKQSDWKIPKQRNQCMLQLDASLLSLAFSFCSSELLSILSP